MSLAASSRGYAQQIQSSRVVAHVRSLFRRRALHDLPHWRLLRDIRHARSLTQAGRVAPSHHQLDWSVSKQPKRAAVDLASQGSARVHGHRVGHPTCVIGVFVAQVDAVLEDGLA